MTGTASSSTCDDKNEERREGTPTEEVKQLESREQPPKTPRHGRSGKK